jgi:tripeptide aminopeptidase
VNLSDVVVRRTIELAEIPAPTGREEARRERVRAWWLADGWADVHADEVGNVWARVRPGDGPSVVICAHLDTVFDDRVDHRVRRDGAVLRGPGVGDDSVGVAALSALGSLLADAAGTTPVWLVATVGEEGLGNLLGISQVMRQDRVPLAAVVAIEGNYLGRIATIGVGSVRWRVTVSGPGGHAWEQAEAPSALHAAAEMVTALAALPADGLSPASGAGPASRATVNVGVFSGGEAVNARARQAEFLLDLRSAGGSAALADLEARARQVIRAPRAEIAAGIKELGRRPAGELSPGHPLVVAAAAALRAAGLPARFTAASTDANAAHAAGVPAIAIGVTTGSGEHTPHEWIDTSPLATGLGCAAATITGWELGSAGEGDRA